MRLEEIAAKYGIKLRDSNNELRNVVDVLEDLYLRLSPAEFVNFMYEISEEEKTFNVFDIERGRRYKGAE